MITHYNEVTETTAPETIDWKHIDFLTAVKGDGQLIIQRASNIPQYGGLVVVIAYQNNFIRVIESLGGQNLIDSLDDGILWGIAMCLARGGSVPLSIKND